ncbi:MAG TPA: type III-B CRISPR module-associated protein Cmr5 [Chloroflexota bacterium]|nr:type III-B CRISPR module-associated protein Cmr5 [Chloroflexota bacterium]
MSQQRSLEQERAGRAWECVQQVQVNGKHYAEDYRRLARGAPAEIQANGLGQTLAFWRAKGTAAHGKLLNDVATALRARSLGGEGQDVVRWIAQTATTDDYRRATVEAMAFLGWVKRFAEADLLGGGNGR